MYKKLTSLRELTYEGYTLDIFYYVTTIAGTVEDCKDIPVYGISMETYKDGNMCDSETIEGISENEDIVVKIVKFLSKETVLPANLVGIIDDLFSEV